MLEEEGDRKKETDREGLIVGVSVCCISTEPITHTETPDSQITHSHNPNCSSQGGLLSLCVNHQLQWNCHKTALTPAIFYILYMFHLIFYMFLTPSPTLNPECPCPQHLLLMTVKWVEELQGIICGSKYIFHPTLSQPHKEHALIHHPNTAALLLTHKSLCQGFQPVDQESATHRDRGRTPEYHAGSGCEQCQHNPHSALLLHGQQTPAPWWRKTQIIDLGREL